MINLYFYVKNPWSDRWDVIKTWHGSTPFKNKFWEAQVDKTNNIFGFEFSITVRQDHSGLRAGLALFGFDFLFNFYDHRHWNYQKNEWEVYGKENLL